MMENRPPHPMEGANSKRLAPGNGARRNAGHRLRSSLPALWLILVAILWAVSPSVQAQDDITARQLADENWEPLFNGRDLDGWTPKIKGYPAGENFGDTFRVAEGLLQVRYDAYERFDDRFGHLFYREELSHYRLRIEYRFVGEQVAGGPEWAIRNSGVMLHGQSPQTMALHQDFPVSIEAQLLGGDGRRHRPTLNVCTPGTHIVMRGERVTRHCTNSQSATYHGDQWVTVEIEVRGGEVIRHQIGGETVLEYSQPQYDPADATAQPLIADGKLSIAGGTISLQSESHPIDFRRIEIQRLPDEDGR